MLKKSFFLLVLSFFMGPLFSYVHPCPGGWAIEGEFLYLQPSIENTHFVVSSDITGFTIGDGEFNDFGFHPGFRVGAAYAFCDCDRDFKVSYSRLSANESKNVAGPFLFATPGNSFLALLLQAFDGTASSDLDLLYQRGDGFFSQKVFCNCGLGLYLLGGFEIFYNRLEEENNYIFPGGGVFGTALRDTKTWGIGPQFGLELDYNICRLSCFCPGTLSFVSCFSGSFLAAKTRENFETIDSVNGVDLNVTDKYPWRVISAWHARVGLNYETRISCFGTSLEIGYEFNTYSRALTRINVPSFSARGNSVANYFNFDLQGLYIAANLIY